MPNYETSFASNALAESKDERLTRKKIDQRIARIANAKNLQAKQQPVPKQKVGPRTLKHLAAKKVRNSARRERKVRESDRKYGPVVFRDFLHAHECLGCGYHGHAIQQAHVETGGVGRKSNAEKTGPLCGPHVELRGETLVRRVGCHALHDAAKRSWRTKSGETFAEAQQKFFKQWEESQ